ncbi:MAG: hypothetical protein ACRCZF_19585 [Gemmataceae bacterium]
MCRTIALLILLLVGSTAAAQAPVAPAPINVVLEDQFDRKPELAQLRGTVAVIVYGDRTAMEACKKLGEQLHVTFHPTAQGLPAAKARQQPVVALPNLPAGVASPEVSVLPVATCGKVPPLLRGLIRGQIKNGAPDVPVWLDFEETMQKTFGQKAGQPNIIVLDGTGVLRQTRLGTATAEQLQETLQLIQNLRAEMVRGK